LKVRLNAASEIMQEPLEEHRSRDTENRKRVLHPSSGRIRIRLIVRYLEGSTLKVLASPRPGIRSITVRVASLASAHEALRSRRISVVSHTGGLAFAMPGTRLTVTCRRHTSEGPV
jgi:hypothetical protein